MANWTAIEDALQSWVATGSGLSGASVVWARQAANNSVAHAPAQSFAVLSIDSIAPIGDDETAQTYDSGAPNGQEITLQAKGVREMVCSVTFYSASTLGANSARALASKASTSLSLDSVASTFSAVGISCLGAGPVQVIDDIVATKFEGRARLEARFLFIETAEDKVGYIGTVETQNYMGPPDLGTRDGIDI